MEPIIKLAEGWWWLVFIFGGGISASVRQAFHRHHKRRLAIISAKAQLADSKSAALKPPPDPQPVCGCSHHLSFHSPSPHSSACAFADCRCQQYIGPEPLGYVVAMPVIDPGTTGQHQTQVPSPGMSPDI